MFSLWFMGDDTLVATFVTNPPAGAEPPELSRAPGGATSPYLLHAVFFDAATGLVEKVAQWPSESRAARVVAVHANKLLLEDGNRLTLCDAQLRPLRSLSLPVRGDVRQLRFYNWFPIASPSGETVLFIWSHSEGSWVRVDTDSLRVEGEWSDRGDARVAIGDSEIARIPCVYSGRCQPSVELRSSSGGWLRVAGATEFSDLQFVAKNLLLVSGNPDMLVDTASGRRFAVDSPGLHYGYHAKGPLEGCQHWFHGSAAVPSAEQRRFVIPVCKSEGAHPALDIDGHSVLKTLLVFDIPSTRPSYVLRVGGPKVEDETYFALSPDGRRLATLDDMHVEVFELPPVVSSTPPP
jgi:hypothetical protein